MFKTFRREMKYLKNNQVKFLKRKTSMSSMKNTLDED